MTGLFQHDAASLGLDQILTRYGFIADHIFHCA